MTAESNSVILINATSGFTTINLPDIGDVEGYTLILKKIDTTTNNIDIKPVIGQLIDNSTKKTITESYASLTIVSSGGDWWII